MVELVVLGTASAVPTGERENTYFAVDGADFQVLVDAPGNPVTRLEQAGLDPLRITDLVLTHFHPDHVAGAPLLLMASWLLGRRTPLHIHGLEATLQNLESMLGLYDWSTWPGMFPCILHHMTASPQQVLIDRPGLRLIASPVRHLIPTIGLRFEFPVIQKVLAYSCDTEPAPAVVELAQQADLLIHEATGETVGHSSARQAGEIASRAGARELMLIHYNDKNAAELLSAAKSEFSGPVQLAKDFQRYPLAGNN